MRFSAPFVTSDLPGGEDVWKVEVGFVFVDAKGHHWMVPAGKITDGASIPQFLWSVVGHPRETDIGQAAALHDDLYCQGFPDRKRCDEILVEGMEALGASWWKRKAVYAGVRAGGWVAWNRYRRRAELCIDP